MAIERDEIPAVVSSFMLFFFVMAGSFAIRPVRETVGTLIGPDLLANVWVGTWLGSLAIIPIYGALVARLRRSVLLPLIYAAVAAALAGVGVALRDGDMSFGAALFFWIFMSVLNLFTVSVFWSFMLEMFCTDQTKRLFGVVAAGGTVGALAGPLFTDFSVSTLGNAGVLFVGAGLFGGAIVCQQILIRRWKATGNTAEADARDRAIGGNPLSGISIVLHSPYLLGIAMFVVLLASASTFLYFEQLRLVAAAYPQAADRTRVFARIDWVVQSLSLVSQLFITGRVASRLGLMVLLMMSPVAMVFGFSALAAWNTFGVFMVVIVLRRFTEYAFVRPGREMLFSPLDKETKYKAKNLIDVPVYRGADALAAQVQKAVGAAGFGPQTIYALGAATAVAWAINGWWLGRRHDAAAQASQGLPGAIPREPLHARIR